MDGRTLAAIVVVVGAKWDRFGVNGVLRLLLFAFAIPVFLCLAYPQKWAWLFGPGLAVWIAFALAIARDRWRAVTEVLLLVALPAWGLWFDIGLSGHCPGEPRLRAVDPFLHGRGIFQDCRWPRPLALPEGYGLCVLLAGLACAFVLARTRRPLSSVAEAVLQGCLVAGVAVHALLSLQLGGSLMALVLPFATLPVLYPFLSVLVYARTLVMRRRLAAIPLGRAVASAVAIGVVYGVVQAAWQHRATAGLDAITRTCGYVLSTRKGTPRFSQCPE